MGRGKALVSLEIKGLEPLLEKLDGLGTRLRNRILRSAFRVAAEPIISDAQASLDRNSAQGGLGDAVQLKIATYKRGKILVLIVGARSHLGDLVSSQGRKYPRNIAALLEFGHGGPTPARAYPFMRPAFDRQGGRFIPIVNDELADELQQMSAG